MIEDLFELSSQDRLRRFQELEAEAARLAARTGTCNVRETYSRIASDWARLATELEETLIPRAGRYLKPPATINK